MSESIAFALEASGKTLKLTPSELLAETTEAEVFKVAEEFLEKVRPIIETRNKLKKAEDDFVYLLSQVVVKLDELILLKNVNAEAEAEVLELLKRELLF